MRNRIFCALALLTLGVLVGCTKEAETPPGALEPHKVSKPEGMSDPRTMTPQAREDMRKKMGR
jgi:hypothetical protein